MKFSNLSKPEGLENLDNYLLLNSFISGVEPTQADLKVFSILKPGLIRPYSNISRWFNNISSFSDAVKHFPASDIIVEVEVEDQSEKKEVEIIPDLHTEMQYLNSKQRNKIYIKLFKYCIVLFASCMPCGL